MSPLEYYPGQFEASATVGTPVIAQYFDQDLVGSTGKSLHHFYESGQMWALIIGVVLGYAFKSASSFG
jgi:hypothetical protein